MLEVNGNSDQSRKAKLDLVNLRITVYMHLTWEARGAQSVTYRTLILYQMTNLFDWSKLVVFADDKISVSQEQKFILGLVENIVGKGENAGYQHFLLFPQCFKNDFILRVVNSRGLCGKELKHGGHLFDPRLGRFLYEDILVNATGFIPFSLLTVILMMVI